MNCPVCTFFYGTPVPNNVASSLLVTTSATNNFYIITSSELKTAGYLKSIELYAASSGYVYFYVIILKIIQLIAL